MGMTTPTENASRSHRDGRIAGYHDAIGLSAADEASRERAWDMGEEADWQAGYRAGVEAWRNDERAPL